MRYKTSNRKIVKIALGYRVLSMGFKSAYTVYITTRSLRYKSFYDI